MRREVGWLLAIGLVGIGCTSALGYDEVQFEDAGAGALPEAGTGHAGSGGAAGLGGNGGEAGAAQAGGKGGSAGTRDAGPGGSAGAAGSSGSGGLAGSSGSGGSGGSPSGPPVNRYGIGYVGPGDAADLELTKKLVGPGGYVLLIFPDVTPQRHDAKQNWKDSVREAYARDLIPVIRMAAPWDYPNGVRSMGESPTSYKALAKSYREIIASLPKRDGWPLYVEVHNEPNLCGEWRCEGYHNDLTETEMASEYAHMLSDVADALHGLGDPRIKVLNAALAPGGVVGCQCPSQTPMQGGTTAISYLEKMMQAVPNIFDKVDVFASHSYPAKGKGWGFWFDYDVSGPGLHFFEDELKAIGKPNMKVILTETGWPTKHPTCGECGTHDRNQIANMTVRAFKELWLTHPRILAVTPFVFRDPGKWGAFGWVDPNRNPYPVYTAVRNLRCSQPGAQFCN